MKSVSGIWKTAIFWKFAVRRRWTDIRREEGHLSDCLFSRGKGWRWAERGRQARNHEVWAFMAKDLQHVSACGMHYPVTLRGGQENFFGISPTERWAMHVDKFCLSNESFLVTKTEHLCVRSSQMERSKFLPAAKERTLCQFRQPMGICTESEGSFTPVMPRQIPSRSALKWSSTPNFSTPLGSFLTPFPSIKKEQVTLLSLPMKRSPLSASVKSF